MRGVVHVVDDDESARKALMRLLRSFECQARGYESGEQLLDATFAVNEPACILLDLRLSGLSGLDVFLDFGFYFCNWGGVFFAGDIVGLVLGEGGRRRIYWC